MVDRAKMLVFGSEQLLEGGAPMVVNARSDQNALDEAAMDALGAGLRGQLVRPQDADYDTARRVYNGMINKIGRAHV